MSGTWTSGWVTGDVVTAAEFRKGVGAVADSTLGSAAASIDFTGLPTSYAHMTIMLQGRGDAATTIAAVQCRFNNDSAANYDYEDLVGLAATPVSSENYGATSMAIGIIAAASAPAGVPGAGRIDIPNYAGTTFNKTAVGVFAAKSGVTTGNVRNDVFGGHWRSTAAINRVTLFPVSGNFVAGTRATVYMMGS